MDKIIFHKAAPKRCYLAFSGGVDSVVLLHLLLQKKVDVTLLWVNHRTEWCEKEYQFLCKTSEKYNLDFIIKTISAYDASTSLECFWSRERNRIYNAIDAPVLVGHHLDDAVEWYIMSTMQGQSKVMCSSNANVLRPLLTTPKRHILEYADYYKLDYLTDPSNSMEHFNLRNNVRINLIPEILKCFPGIYKTVKKLVINKKFESFN